MEKFVWFIPLALATVAAGYATFAFATRGFKGAMFGYKIARTHSGDIVYRRRGAKHTFRLHHLDADDLYGLEIGIWSVVFGETSAIVIPRVELLKLRDAISDFVEEDSAGSVDEMASA